MILLALLALSAAALVVVSLATARRPTAAIPDFDGYLARWARLHDGHDPRTNAWLIGWLRLSFWLSRPLARAGVLPDVLTVWSVWLAFAVFVPAQAGGYWPILGGWILVASGLFDTIDGCVAALTDRATRFGYVLDSTVDRVNDVIYLAAVVSVGAPQWLAIATGCGFFLLEYVRARAGNAGGSPIGTVTVGERANRVICLSAGIHFGGVFVQQATLVATLATSAIAVLTLVGLGQLVVAVRRELVGPASVGADALSPSAASGRRRVD